MEKLGIGDEGQSRVATLYRTAAARAYQAGRREEDLGAADVWGFRYVTMRDDRVRPEHAALNGTTLPQGHPFWTTHWPPNGWNCRCQVVTLYRETRVVKPGKIHGRVPQPDEGFEYSLEAPEFAMSL
jgi:SPP1 gp7 family putative phage head morphogenesis protein